jgi:hypothetical protein
MHGDRGSASLLYESQEIDTGRNRIEHSDFGRDWDGHVARECSHDLHRRVDQLHGGERKV